MVNKSEIERVWDKSCYLNVVYKVLEITCIFGIFPPDLQTSEVVSWDDLSRGNREIKCHKPFRYAG